MRRLREERGASLVEFAVVFPLLFLVVLVLLTTLWMLTARSAITGAARDGARFASIRHDAFECTGPPCPTGYPTEAEVEEHVRERAGRFDVDEIIVERPTAPNAPVTVTVRRELPVLFGALASVFGEGDLVYESVAKVRAE